MPKDKEQLVCCLNPDCKVIGIRGAEMDVHIERCLAGRKMSMPPDRMHLKKA